MKYPTYPKLGRPRWPGSEAMPEGWEVRRLKFAATCNDEALPESTDPDYDIAYVDISSVDLVEGITKVESMPFEEAPSRARRIVRDGDTVISTVRTYLKAIAPIKDPPENMIVSTGFAVVRPLEGINSDFLGYALQGSAFIGEVVANSTGVSYPAINPTDLVCLAVGYPEKTDEQKHIAMFLDWKTRQIDALIEKKRALLEKLKEKRLAVISRAVTQGLNPDIPLKDSGIPWLGKIPEHWDLPPLKFRYSVELGKMLDEKRITGDDLVPYLRNIDVQWDAINYDELPSMDITEEEYSRYTIKEGDLLVCEGGEVGRCAIVGSLVGVVGYQKALHRLRALTDSEIPRFMFYTLLWAVSSEVFSAEGSSTISHLTADQLRRYRFPRPPRCEQQSIISFLEKEMTETNRLMGKISKAIGMLTEYRTALISAATAGKIDVRGVKLPFTAT